MSEAPRLPSSNEQAPPKDIVSELRGDAAMHRFYKRDWSAELLERAAKEIERLREQTCAS